MVFQYKKNTLYSKKKIPDIRTAPSLNSVTLCSADQQRRYHDKWQLLPCLYRSTDMKPLTSLLRGDTVDRCAALPRFKFLDWCLITVDLYYHTMRALTAAEGE